MYIVEKRSYIKKPGDDSGKVYGVGAELDFEPQDADVLLRQGNISRKRISVTEQAKGTVAKIKDAILPPKTEKPEKKRKPKGKK